MIRDGGFMPHPTIPLCKKNNILSVYKSIILTIFIALTSINFDSCKKLPQLDRNTATMIKKSHANTQTIISKCKVEPGKKEDIGHYGGYWNMRISSDPMTFNTLTARDSDSRMAIDWLTTSTVTYDVFTKEWKSALVDFHIENDLKQNRQTITCTIKDNALWYLPDSNKTVPITSNDIAFWFDEIEGDIALQHPGYAGHFVQMEDGSSAKIEIEVLNKKQYRYHFPRISCDPILEIANDFGPHFIFGPTKKAAYEKRYKEAITELSKKGLSPNEIEEQAKEIASSAAAAALNNLFSINSDPKKIPTCGPFYIESYQPGIKITLKKNPHYYLKDSEGNTLPYIDGLIYHIIRDDESAILEFLNGTIDTVGVPHEKLERMLEEQKRLPFSIYFGGAALASSFICMNQNPVAMPQNSFKWFTKKEFRQAISCLINREELISQIYLGLATQNNDFFNKANSMYNPAIKMNYGYNPEYALELLHKIGMRQNQKGELLDKEGNIVSFTFSYTADSDTSEKIASIIAHNISKAGIEVKLKPTDFQKIVNSLIKTYDWEMVNVSLGGNYWPTGGSNVWQSSGNFHLWRPNQETPATDWEAKVDELYNKGRFAPDQKSAFKYWSEYQELILEQMPLIYLPYSYSFRAFSDRWENITYDILPGYNEGVDIRYVYLKEN